MLLVYLGANLIGMSVFFFFWCCPIWAY